MTLVLETHTFLWFWWADLQLCANATAAVCDARQPQGHQPGEFVGSRYRIEPQELDPGKSR
jgi:hypothetical protein